MAAKRSFNEVQALVRAKLNEGRVTPQSEYYICECFEDRVIFSSYSDTEYWQISFSIDADGNVTLGNDKTPVKRETKYVPVKAKFSFSGAVGESIRYVGKVFELGSWADKAFSLNDAEANDAIEAFNETDKVNLEHKKSIFDGKLGTVKKLWREGTDLMAEWLAPKALFDLLGKEVTVSAEWVWDDGPKRFGGLAITDNPRITDARLQAAFSAARNEGTVMNSQFTEQEGGILKKIAKFFGGGGEEPSPGPGTGGTPQSTFSDPAKDAEIDRLNKELEASRSTQLKVCAAEFANELITAGKAIPAQRDAIETTYVNLAKADNAGKAMFSADGKIVEGEGLKAYRASFEKIESDKQAADGTQVTIIQPGSGGENRAQFSTLDVYAKRAQVMAAAAKGV